MSGQRAGDPRHQVFISYVREDDARVDRLQNILEWAGIRTWRDTRNVEPGCEWREEIRRAVMASSLAFIACFSENSERKTITHQNEELILAVEQMRLRVPDSSWLIPIRFADCRIPAFDLGAGRKLDDTLQRLDLFDGSWESGIPVLLGTLLSNLDRSRYAGGVGIYSTYLGSQLGAGQAMYGSQYLMSDDNRFVFILQYDGNIVLYEPGYKPAWGVRHGRQGRHPAHHAR